MFKEDKKSPGRMFYHAYFHCTIFWLTHHYSKNLSSKKGDKFDFWD